MNNIDFSAASVNPKITIVKKQKALTVALFFPKLMEEGAFTETLAVKVYDGSPELLFEITKAAAVVAAKSVAFGTDALTVSNIAAKQKSFAAHWWTYLKEEIFLGPQAEDKALRKRLELAVKNAFDAYFHKLLTGKDLPESKDGFEANAMRALRKATEHGDAAIFLYRLRYWWPKAQIVIDSKMWVANTHREWAEQLGMEVRAFRTAYDRLVVSGMIEARVAKFKGRTMNHVRPTDHTQALYAKLEKQKTN